MSKRSLRVYMVRHHTGHVTGILLRAWTSFFDAPPPSAFGASEDDVLAALEIELLARASRGDPLERYLWSASFDVRAVTVEALVQSTVRKRTVIGKRAVPLRVTYLAGEIDGGGVRIVVPRFGWRFIVEEVSIAGPVIERAVATMLAGEHASSVYDLRAEKDEYVRAWSPRLLESSDAAEPDEPSDYPAVRMVADDLVERAARGKLPVIVGPMRELDAAAPLIKRSPPASIALVGPPGVGKTAWVIALARRMLQASREKPRRAVPRIWSTSADRILSGMKYLGMWQERCLAMVEELSGEGDYLHVTRLLDVLRPQPDGASIAEILAPAIRAGEVSVIVEATEEELIAAERRAASLVASLEIVRLTEPPPAAIPALLDEYELRRSARVHLHPAGKKRLVSHLTMFRRDVAFPGKAFRFYDFVQQEAEGREAAEPSEQGESGPRVLYPRDVSEAYARWSGLPIEIISDELPAGAEVIAERLRRRVIGQDHACAVASRVLARFKANMNDPERPAGVLLFVGPTGVGKTELAKEMARAMFGDRPMIRLDMSEYAHPGSVARLCEAGRGSTSLAQRARQEPLSLVLFDEIEKADSEVLDLLLGVLGEGRLTDEDGRLVDMRMTVIVMTSNLGVGGRTVGFGGGDAETSIRAVRDHFRPELYNRIDHVVPFRALSRDDVLRIVDLELQKAAARTGLVRRRLTIAVDAAARAKIAELGYHPTKGARPLKRVIEELVITPVATRMAADARLADATIAVGVGPGDAIVIS